MCVYIYLSIYIYLYISISLSLSIHTHTHTHIFFPVYIEGESAKLSKKYLFLDLWLMPLYSTGGVHIQLTLQELIMGISLLKEYNYCATDGSE